MKKEGTLKTTKKDSNAIRRHVVRAHKQKRSKEAAYQVRVKE